MNGYHYRFWSEGSHGLGRARSRGLEKMNEQVTLTAIAQNLKRLVKFLNNPGKAASSQGALRPKSKMMAIHSACRRFLLKIPGPIDCLST